MLALSANLLPVLLGVVTLLLPNIEVYKKRELPTVYFESDLQSQSIDQVMRFDDSVWRTEKARRTTTVGGTLATSWSRIFLAPAKPTGGPELVAELEFPTDRKVEYYLVENGQVIDQMKVGVPRADGAFGAYGATSAFSFQSGPRDSRYLYVKSIVSGRILAAPVIYTAEDFREVAFLRHILVGVMLGCTLGLALYNVFLVFMMRQFMYFYHALFLVAIMSLTVVTSGALEIFFPNLAVDYELYSRLVAVCAVLVMTSILLFQMAFLGGEKLKYGILRYNYALATMMLTILLLIPWLQIQAYLALIIVGMAVIVIRGRVISLTYAEIPAVRKFSTAMGCLAASLVVTFLAWFHWVEPDFFRTYMFNFVAIFTAAFFSSAQSLRIRELESLRQGLIEDIKNKSHFPNIKTGVTDLAASGGLDHSAVETAEVCVMFIDIVAFSQISAPLPSSKVFAELSRRIAEISSIVRSHGGNIDRSLGDGVLCFFGYDTGDDSRMNTLNAFKAACEIQLKTAHVATEKGIEDGGRLLMPVRIGIHSTQVVMGNLGGGTRIDFSMIGSGLNFASRLESACSPFKIIVSDVCRDHLVDLGRDRDVFADISIAIKHKDALVSASEYDPFSAQPEVLHAAEQRYFKQLGFRSIDQRFVVINSDSIRLVSSYGAFFVRDLSVHGFRVQGLKLFGRMSTLAVAIETSNSQINEKLNQRLLNELTIEVRWGRRVQNGFEHGMRIVGGNDEQRRYIFDLLSQCAAGVERPEPLKVSDVA